MKVKFTQNAIFTFILAVLILTIFTACSREQPVSSNPSMSVCSSTDSIHLQTTSFSSNTNNSSTSQSSKEAQSVTTLKPFDSKELKFIGMTIEECDALFGKPLEVTQEVEHEFISGYDEEIYMTRKYQNVTCKFDKYTRHIGDIPEIILDTMEVLKPGYSPLRGIKVGDSLESVLAKFPDENRDIYKDTDGKTNIKPLYGTCKWEQSYGRITYYEQPSDNYLVWAKFSDGWWILSLGIDSNNCVGYIRVNRTA